MSTDGATAVQAEPEGQDQGFQLPPEARRLSELIDAITPWAIRVVATLRVPDLIADGVTELADLAERTGTLPGTLQRLLRHLVNKQFFAEPAPGRYALTAVSELLRDSQPMHMRAWLDLGSAACRWDKTYIGMLDAVRTGKPVYGDIFGQSFWDDLTADPALSESFDALMVQLASWSVPQVLADYDWSRIRHVVDVGGGRGVLLTELLRAHPQIRGTLFDKPATASAASAALAEAGLAGRCESVGGSFFDELPADADLYLLANVLHDWDDADAAAILRRCASAAAPHGRVLVLEMLLGGRADQAWLAEMDLMMLCAVGGRKRTTDEFTELGQAAGLVLNSARHTPAGISLLEFKTA